MNMGKGNGLWSKAQIPVGIIKDSQRIKLVKFLLPMSNLKLDIVSKKTGNFQNISSAMGPVAQCRLKNIRKLEKENSLKYGVKLPALNWPMLSNLPKRLQIAKKSKETTALKAKAFSIRIHIPG